MINGHNNKENEKNSNQIRHVPNRQHGSIELAKSADLHFYSYGVIVSNVNNTETISIYFKFNCLKFALIVQTEIHYKHDLLSIHFVCKLELLGKKKNNFHWSAFTQSRFIYNNILKPPSQQTHTQVVFQKTESVIISFATF